MQPQLDEIARELRSAQQRLHRLAGAVPDARWAERPDPERWSIGECVAHLNLTSEAYLPLLRAALADAPRSDAARARRFRRDPVGWLLTRTMGPQPRVRMRAPAAFVPQADQPAAELRRRFDELQDQQLALVEGADGVELDRVRLQSPFDARVRYNLLSCLELIHLHQHRHLWQAEQVAARLEPVLLA